MWVVPIEAQGQQLSGMAPDSAPPVSSDAAKLQARLAAEGVALGTPIMIRIFKEEAELEVWVDKGARYARFATSRSATGRACLAPS